MPSTTYPQGMHKVNDSGVTMSAEAMFEVKTYSASMSNYSTGNRATAPPDRRGAKIIREYKTKLKSVDKKFAAEVVGNGLNDEQHSSPF